MKQANISGNVKKQLFQDQVKANNEQEAQEWFVRYSDGSSGVVKMGLDEFLVLTDWESVGAAIDASGFIEVSIVGLVKEEPCTE